MPSYIVTFFSHYDALTFFNHAKERDTGAGLMPVPRKVSASCGTCVSYMSDTVIDCKGCEAEAVYEAVYIETEKGFVQIL